MQTTTCPCCNKIVPVAEMEPNYIYPNRVSYLHRHDLMEQVDVITDDYIEANGRYYIRGTLPLEVQGRDKPFSIGIWAEVGLDDFFNYLRTFRDDDRYEFVGELANSVEGHSDSFGMKVKIETQGITQRPIFTVLDTTSSLGLAQKHGIKEHDTALYFGALFQ
jgi:hypothetical protein